MLRSEFPDLSEGPQLPQMRRHSNRKRKQPKRMKSLPQKSEVTKKVKSFLGSKSNHPTGAETDKAGPETNESPREV